MYQEKEIAAARDRKHFEEEAQLEHSSSKNWIKTSAIFFTTAKF